MRRLLSSKSPLVAGAIPFLIWVAGAHILVGYVLAPLLSPFGIVFSVKELPEYYTCLLYTSPSPRDRTRSRMPSSA